MEKSSLICVIIASLFVASNRGTILSWNIFRNLGTVPPNIKDYASQRLAALRNLRDQAYNATGKPVHRHIGNNSEGTTVYTESSRHKQLDKISLNKTMEQITEKPGTREIMSGRTIFRSLEKLFTLTSPIKKMITSPQGIESLASMVMPKRDVLQKLLEIKGHLEPSVRRYLTDTYNNFLTSLVPYSENIGVPPFVLNSMKIPMGLDPRWLLIKSMVNSENGVQNFIHSIVSGNPFEKLPEVVESRSGDETDLISDQEPDATGQHYRKHQQMYLNSFKKRLMKPVGSRYRLVSTAGGILRPALDYEHLLDQTG